MLDGVGSWPRRLRQAATTPWIRSLAVLWVAQVMAELAFAFALPFIPLYIQELGVTDVTQAALWAGLMAGAFAVVMGLMGPIWGLAADRYGRRLMIQRALFGACVAIGGMAFVTSPEQLLVLRILQGSLTGVVAATTTVVSLTVPRQHLGTALGLMHAAMFAGTALGPIIGGVVSDSFGYRAAFVVTGGLFLISGALVTLFVLEPPRESAESERVRPSLGQAMWQILGRRELAAVIGIMALIRFATVAPQPVLPFFVKDLVDDPTRLATQTGLVLAATGVASTVSALTIGPLADRWGHRRTLLICLVASALLAAPHALVTTFWQLLGLRTAMGLAIGGMMPSAQAIFTDLTPPSRRGMAFGLLATSNAFGNGAGPIVGSIVAAIANVPSVFLVMSPFFLLGAGLLTRLPLTPAPVAAPPPTPVDVERS